MNWYAYRTYNVSYHRTFRRGPDGIVGFGAAFLYTRICYTYTYSPKLYRLSMAIIRQIPIIKMRER